MDEPQRAMRQPELLLLIDTYERLAQLRVALSAAYTSLIALGKRSRAVLRWVAAVPEIEIELSESAGGRSIRRSLTGRRWGVPKTWGVSALTLPDDAEEYFRGRSKQALRTNRARAIEAGMHACQVVALVDQLHLLTGLRNSGVPPATVGWLESRARAREGAMWFVLDQDSTPLGASHVSIDGRTARPDIGVVRDVAFRYLLCARLFADLVPMGVRLVLMDTTVFLKPGLVYFQQRLGFGLASVRLKQAIPLSQYATRLPQSISSTAS